MGNDEPSAPPPRSAISNGQSEFEQRRLHNAGGQFLGAGVLAANGDIPLLELLTTRLRGFTTTGDARGAAGVRSSCELQVFVNGLPTAAAFDALHPRDLFGVEYYDAASAPIKYRRAFSACPVLLLWLRL
jgi:hypothetical protein